MAFPVNEEDQVTMPLLIVFPVPDTLHVTEEEFSASQLMVVDVVPWQMEVGPLRDMIRTGSN